MDARSLIAAKRDGARWSRADIEWAVAAVCGGAMSPEQLGAWLMVACLRGLDERETRDLTLAMQRSGASLRWDRAALPGPVVDKHSTGGVGDLVSLVLAPALAAAGACVPMISGRSLGPMGGTLDKLEAVPGLRTTLSLEDLQTQVARIGVAIVGPTPELVPADGLLYAARDVTATVGCTPLIVASILSKKLAEGLDALALDVKFGSGAVFARRGEAEALADALAATAACAGLETRVCLSDMNQPLAPVAGNALELAAAVDYLVGSARPRRLGALLRELGAGLLEAAGFDDGARRFDEALASGAAAEVFGRLVAAQGGPPDLLERPWRHLPAAPVRRVLEAPAGGRVMRADAGCIGRAVLGLGGGRMRGGECIDGAVGVARIAELGQRVARGEPLAEVHARDEAGAERALATLAGAFRLTAAGEGDPE